MSHGNAPAGIPCRDGKSPASFSSWSNHSTTRSLRSLKDTKEMGVPIPDTRHFMNRSPQGMTQGSFGIDMRLPWTGTAVTIRNVIGIK
ncbi:hypothetical protein JCM14469_19590 [Desulfatiferula olefinivorans]